MKKISVSLVAIISCLAGTAAYADDVTDSIKEGTVYYQDENYSAALSSFNYVVQLITQKASESLVKFLPEPIDGFEMSEPEMQSAGMGMFGGGNSVSADYSNEEGNINISISANSPALQSILMVVNNPMFLGASGQKMERVAGQKAIIDYDNSDKSGLINIVVGGSALVTAEGSDVSLDQMKELIGSVDFKKLTAFVTQ
jgi:hypothetical protein